MIHLNRINGSNPIFISNSENRNDILEQNKKIIVPVGEKLEHQQKNDDLPQGLYVEKSQDRPSPEPTEAPTEEIQDITPSPAPTEAPTEEVEDKTPENEQATVPANDDIEDIEVPDTNVYPDERITVDNIALGQADKIDDILEGAEIKGINSAIEESASKLDKALTMIQTDPHSVMEQDFKKGVHGIGLARYELTDYSIDLNLGSSTSSYTRTTDTKRVDFNGTYENPEGNTKLMLFASGTVTNRHVKMNTTDDNTDVNTNTQEVPNEQDASPAEENLSIAEEVTESREKYNQYRLYLGGKFKLGKDELNTCITHAKGGTLNNSVTTQIDARYHFNNYNVNVDGTTIIYNIGPTTSTKTNISCYFNAKEPNTSTEQETPAQEVTPDENNATEEDQTTPVNNRKKWAKRGGLIIKGESVNGEYEQGLGYYEVFKKLGDNHSVLKITPFVLGSTTPRKDETSSYHFTTGVNLKYNRRFNPNSLLSTSLDVKDRISFCGDDKGNIFTAFVDANYTYKKFNAKLEGKYILVPDSKYAAIAFRGSYRANKNLQLFGETSYLNQTTEAVKLKGGSLMLGANVTF